MQYYNSTTPSPFASGARTVAEQVNAVLKKVYVRMFVGLLISAFVAMGIASSKAALLFIHGNPIVYWGMFKAQQHEYRHLPGPLLCLCGSDGSLPEQHFRSL